jgi:DNA-binding NarL/FixJ family response regulator
MITQTRRITIGAYGLQEKFWPIPQAPKSRKSSVRYAKSVATVLLASDLASLRRELETMLAGPDVLIEETSSGPETIERVKRGDVDLVIADLQIGAMGGMAITMELRNLESYGGADPVSVLMLLDRRPDVFLARRAGADGFIVKPLDPQRMRSAVRALLRGESYEDESLRPATVRVGSTDAR